MEKESYSFICWSVLNELNDIFYVEQGRCMKTSNMLVGMTKRRLVHRCRE